MNCENFILDNLDKVPFKDEIAEAYSTDFYKFSFKQIYKKNASIDITKIKGTNHPNYKNLTWENVLKSLKRNSNLKHLYCSGDKRLSVKYYYDIEYRKNCLADNAWNVNVLNDEEYYICDGNHRSTISKFLATLNAIPKMIPVPNVYFYYFNKKDILLYSRLQKVIKRLNKNSMENKFYIKLEKEQLLIESKKTSNEVIDDYQLVYKLIIFLHAHKEKNVYKEYNNVLDLKKDLFQELIGYRKRTKNNIIEVALEKIIKKLFNYL
ncbi:MAG TPA: hypothetical protein EYG73_09040 [Arcobacter sp.]|nr:hypothetical protein [Arcobacter sp.]